MPSHVHLCAQGRGVLRLRKNFASRSSCCAQDDTVRTLCLSEVKSKFIRHRLTRVRVIIEPAPRLPPIPPRHHHPLQQRRRREPPFLELVIHHVRNVVSRIEADEIEQRKRTHWIPA